MKKLLILAFTPLLVAASSPMSVADFIAQVDALEKMGLMALISPKARELKGEVDRLEDNYRAGIAADLAARRRPSSCPPPRGQNRISNKRFMAELRKVPESARPTTPMTKAFAEIMARAYPCTSG